MKQKKTIAQRVSGKPLLQVGSIALVSVGKKRRPRIVKKQETELDPNQLALFSSDGMHLS